MQLLAGTPWAGLMTPAGKVSLARRAWSEPEGAARDRPEKGATAGRRGRREGGCCKREEVGGEGGGGGTLTGSRPGGGISFKQYLCVGLSCLR